MRLGKAAPYCSYEHFDFNIPVGSVGDNYDRYEVRLQEIHESVKIIEQALDGLPEGPYITEDRKYALPPRHELATSMEALIHHFKLVTEGFRVPPGEVYFPIESPRGELGCFVRSDGSSKPARVHMRDPSLRQPAGDCGRCARTSTSPTSSPRWRCSTRSSGASTGEHDLGRDLVRRYEHGSRVPGWDEAADLDEGPGRRPRPRDDARPGGAARR